MAGSGDMLPRLIERVGQLRLGRHFHFTGFLRGEDVERMYAQSDLYVMPSVSEPFGISPLEAMLYDVPVIISRHAGVGEVLTHALKVDFWDVTDMANKILAVLKYPALSRELLRNGRRELQAIRWDVSAERILSVYQRVTS
jgi:glycosyltransferase involved in cell wall biosynthesis